MNYVFANNILFIVGDSYSNVHGKFCGLKESMLNQIIFKKADLLRDIIDLNSHTLTIEFPEGTTSQEVADLVQLVSYDPESEVEEGTFLLRNEDIQINGFHVFVKKPKAETWISLSQFVTDKVEALEVHETESNTTILLPNFVLTPEYVETLLHLDNILMIPVNPEFDYVDDKVVDSSLDYMTEEERTNAPFITNINELQLRGYIRFIGTNRQIYSEDEYWMNILDYTSELTRYLSTLYNKSIFVNSVDDQAHFPAHTRIYTCNQEELFQRQDFSTHRIWHPELGYIMRTEAELKFEFICDDIQILQKFVSDYNNNLDINKQQWFRTEEDYTGIDFSKKEYSDDKHHHSPHNSRYGWNCTLVWQDFLDGTFDSKPNSKVVENGNLYSVPFTCRVIGITASGLPDQTVILSYITNLILSMGVNLVVNPNIAIQEGQLNPPKSVLCYDKEKNDKLGTPSKVINFNKIEKVGNNRLPIINYHRQ